MTKLTTAVLARPTLAMAVVISALTLVGLLTLFTVKNSFATDFSVYWRTANEPLDMAYLPQGELPFPYPPTMLLWIAPLKLAPMWPAFLIWVALSATLLWKACQPFLSPWAVALVLLSPPLVNGLSTGQVSAMVAAALLWACSTSNRVVAGMVFGVVASIKPQLVIMAPLLLIVTFDWKALVGSAATYCLIFMASVLAFGLDVWFVWLGSLDHFRDVLHNEQVLGVAATPAAAAENYGFPPLPFLVGGAAFGAWLVYRCRWHEPLGRSAAIACGSLLAAPYALTYDLAAVIPFLVSSIFRERLSSALALSGVMHPIPLVLTAFGLITRQR
ncbi:glycosyltransferase family 87 protein [Sphingomonas xanthus]|uniref:DUF2029 domain-containing protein n=1 Tax=Sphingomonas xanthus TaxID=2594473 RepID=A0A516IPG2_9SPHN|nr:glycosyltransferase family 87 protein [Sphingomonas xanthus]QDP18818.1 DUF2029 domain-containing protein [Sphingomonas xanthus]